MTQKQTEAMTQAEQIINKHSKHYGKFPDFTHPERCTMRGDEVLAAIQEALDLKEKELEALREVVKKRVIYAFNVGWRECQLPKSMRDYKDAEDYYTKNFTNE